MQKYWGLRGSRLVWAMLFLIVAPAYTCYGYNQGVAGNVLTLQSFIGAFPDIDTSNTTGAQRKSNSTIQGLVIALFTLGSSIGALICMKFGDLLGRRKTIFCSTAIAVVGAILMASSFSLAQLIVARIVLGVGSGGYTATIPVWQSEISGAQHRGAFVNSEGIFLGLGITISLLVDFGFFFVGDNSVSWRFPFALQIILLLMVLAFVFTLPESPRWLIKKGRLQEATEVLSALHEFSSDLKPVQEDIAVIQRSLEVGASQKGALQDLLQMGPQRVLHRAVIACLGQLFQQMCGVSLTVAYATTIYEQHLGFHAVKSRGLSIAMLSLHIIGGSISVLLVDRVGRRPLMLTSAAVMSICMTVLAGATSHPERKACLYAATFFLFLYTPFFAVGFLSLTNLYAPEIAPLEARAAIAGVSTATSWMANFVVLLVTPVGFDNIQYRYWIVYAVINAAIVPTIYWLFPETQGLGLEEIDSIFVRSNSIWDPTKIARVMVNEKRRTITADEEPHVEVKDAVDK